ncbi:hypothetical protein [Rhizobium sp. BK176]|uniref:hypothetical protein n=1 Tax=Rhizobium sp. BK176 TaxID=2587071 RepID=UPI002168F78B|nr:hypothetical protein [Rhizobium sp. BK176]MCS4089954.1 hypothetical protein [Rhizobium sp. BK176]
MNVKPSYKVSTAAGATAAALVLAATVYLVFFSPANVLLGIVWDQMKAPQRAHEQYLAQQQATFKATWEARCARTPAGKIGYPLASNFSHFYVPNSLDLDFQEGPQASYHLDDLKVVDCPHNPKS